MGRRQKARKEKRNLKLVSNNKGPKVNGSGIVQRVTLPDGVKELIKTVPAKVDDVIVGDALIYDDGSVDIRIDEDAPKWAVDKIRATEQQFGYTIGGE